MNHEIIVTLLHSLSDRAKCVQGKIDHANENLNAVRYPEFWLNERTFWENRLKEVEEAREAIYALPDN
jgi:hypothetical protein